MNDPTYRGFMADILAKPEEDGLRLILADWLEEHGQEERAEFIRVQVELARKGKLRDGSDCPCQNCAALRSRERELLQGTGADSLGMNYAAEWWFKSLGIDTESHGFDFFFHRGFVERIVCTAADFLTHSGALFAAQPITEVKLTDYVGWCGNGGPEKGNRPSLFGGPGNPVLVRDWNIRGHYRYECRRAFTKDCEDVLDVLKQEWPQVKEWMVSRVTDIDWWSQSIILPRGIGGRFGDFEEEGS